MSTQTQSRNISGGIFLIGLGILFLVDWWWPGIMLVIGAAAAADHALRGAWPKAIGIFALFAGIPLVIELVGLITIPWPILLPILLIGLGILVLFQTLRRSE